MNERSEAGEVVLLGLGANLGNALSQLQVAIESLAVVVSELRASAVYRTPAVGPQPQPDYLNAVVRGRTLQSPRETLELARELEEKAGRTRPYPNAPRTLDVDLLFHGGAVIHERTLDVPHPRWSERAFVVVPLLDVAPEWRDPETGRTVSEVASAKGWTVDYFPRVVEAGDLFPSRIP